MRSRSSLLPRGTRRHSSAQEAQCGMGSKLVLASTLTQSLSFALSNGTGDLRRENKQRPVSPARSPLAPPRLTPESPEVRAGCQRRPGQRLSGHPSRLFAVSGLDRGGRGSRLYHPGGERSSAASTRRYAQLRIPPLLSPSRDALAKTGRVSSSIFANEMPVDSSREHSQRNTPERVMILTTVSRLDVRPPHSPDPWEGRCSLWRARHQRPPLSSYPRQHP